MARRRYSRKKSAPRSRRSSNSFGLLTMGAGLNALFQLGVIDAVTNILDGGTFGRSFELMRDQISWSTMTASAVPFIGIGLMKKFVGQKTIFGPLKLF